MQDSDYVMAGTGLLECPAHNLDHHGFIDPQCDTCHRALGLFVGMHP